ncbi:GNAT family N-acetyltransferase [Saccharothrix texasensis]|uniref:Putative acetyltransferase n=1 Tax=Saccharothrix texasensis TaxID=103734 RepID=A0A3N1H0W1_9PSEU|nr:GNAT family N-acetyltransferase [Saccharothrix texasensis]ROP36118.1 putative acetyltransferase [Saccharothrix texasensis]
MTDHPRAEPALIAPTTRLHHAWLAARDDWGPGVHEDGFGLHPSDEVDSPPGFAAWVARLTDVPGSVCRWIVEGDRVLGGIALRLGPADHVRVFGHIGYGIRPSARGRGLATWALGRMLVEAGSLGLTEVLLVCEDHNTASVKTIERNGGTFDGVQSTDLGPLRRYLITLR